MRPFIELFKINNFNYRKVKPFEKFTHKYLLVHTKSHIMIAILFTANAKNILKSKILTRLYKITPSLARLNTFTNA
jgi:hypothetical protein